MPEWPPPPVGVPQPRDGQAQNRSDPGISRRSLLRRWLVWPAIRYGRVSRVPDVRLEAGVAVERVEQPIVARISDIDAELPTAAVAWIVTSFDTQVSGQVFGRERSISKRWSGPRRVTNGVSDAPALDTLYPLLVNQKLIARSFGPLILPHPLYQFQRDGIEFLLDRTPGALLADDMGLGKTVQAMVALRHLMQLGEVKRALVVAPKSVVTSWRRHFAEWAPELRIGVIQGSPWHREQCWYGLRQGEFDVGVITYDSLRSDVQELQLPSFDLVIADEIQSIKNPTTQRSRAMRSLKAERRWGLTGTPLENRVSEMTSILHYLDPAVPQTIDDPATVRRYAKPRMRRRRKEQVLDELPEKFTHIEYIELLPPQRRAYQRAENEGVNELAGKPRNITNVLTLITRLKQICNGVGNESAKLEWLQGYMEEANAEGDKVLVFSQWIEHGLDPIERKLAVYEPLKYYGGLTGKRRDDAVDAFRNERRHRVMVLQTRAGGLGLNLQAANRVVHFDSWWNPAVQSQATARAHRLGQRKTVFETTLVCVDTIEERIQALLESKRQLFAEVVDDLSVNGLARSLNETELYGLFDLDPPPRRQA